MTSRADYIAYAREAAQQANIDAAIFVRMIDAESGFDPDALSPAGAVGIAQIMPQYHPGVNPRDPFDSLTYAARLIAGYLREFGSYELALAAYNAGAGAVRQYGGIPPYAETQTYIQKILGSLTNVPAVASSARGVSPFVFVGLLVAAWYLLRG